MLNSLIDCDVLEDVSFVELDICGDRMQLNT